MMSKNMFRSMRGAMTALLFIGAASAVNAQESQQLCSGQPIPEGWVHVNTYTSPSCPGSTNNARTIQNTAGQSQMTICTDHGKLPYNWVWLSSGTSFSQCLQYPGSAGTSTRWNNVRTIRNVTRETQITACMVNPSDYVDWEVIYSSTNQQTCLPMSPSATVSVFNNIATMRRRCILTASPAVVGAGQPFSYTIQGATIPSGSHGLWHGTKNGVPDTAGFDFGVVPTTMSYVNQPGWEGQYTRYAEIRTLQNVLACRTNTVDQTLAYTAPPPPPPPVCTLTGSSATVGPNQPYAFYATVQGSLPAGSQAYWYGTNGNSPVTHVPAGAIPQTFSYTNQPGWAGTYTRQLRVFNGQAEVCRTGTVSMTLQ